MTTLYDDESSSKIDRVPSSERMQISLLSLLMSTDAMLVTLTSEINFVNSCDHIFSEPYCDAVSMNFLVIKMAWTGPLCNCKILSTYRVCMLMM